MKKTYYDAKTLDNETKYFSTSDHNKFTCEILDANMKEKRLVDKSDISRFINDCDLDKKIAISATKTELKKEQDKIIKLQAFDSSYFSGKSHFENDVFQYVPKNLKTVVNTNKVAARKSKGLSVKVLNFLARKIMILIQK